MNKDQNLHGNLSIIKANALSNGIYNLTQNESRFIEAACSQIKNGDKEFSTTRFRVKDVLDLSGVSDDKIYLTCRETIRRLSTRSVEIEGTIQGKKALIVYPWLDEFNYYDGMVELKLHRRLIPFLLEIRDDMSHYTIYNLADVLALPTFYSQRLFIILKSYLNLKEVGFSVDDWRSRFGLAEDKHTLYGNFKNRVLIPSIESVKERTYIKKIEIIEKKEKRKVVFITLRFERQENVQIEEDKAIKTPPKLLQKKPSTPLPEPLEQDQTRALIESVLIYGIKPKTVAQAIESHGLNSIIAIRDHVLDVILKRKKTSNPIMNPSGYIAHAFSQGWKIIEKETQEEALQARHPPIDNKRILDQITMHVINVRRKKLNTLVENLTKEQEANFRLAFENEINNNNYADMLEAFSQKGWKVLGINSVFKQSFLADKLLPPEIEELQEYAKSLGYDYDSLKAS